MFEEVMHRVMLVLAGFGIGLVYVVLVSGLFGGWKCPWEPMPSTSAAFAGANFVLLLGYVGWIIFAGARAAHRKTAGDGQKAPLR